MEAVRDTLSDPLKPRLPALDTPAILSNGTADDETAHRLHDDCQSDGVPLDRLRRLTAERDSALERLAASEAECAALRERLRQAEAAPKPAASAPRPAPKIAPRELNWDTRSIPSETRPSSDALPAERRILILPVIYQERNTTRYRARHLEEQLVALGYDPRVIDHETNQAAIWKLLANARLPVILQRFHRDRANAAFLDRLKQAAGCLVYDIDDLLFDPAELEPERPQSWERLPSEYRAAMALADQFLVSTKALRNHVEAAFGKPVHVIQNVLSREQVERSTAAFATRVWEPETVTIGYAAGSATHDRDFAIVEPVLERLLDSHPQIRLVLIGFVNLNPRILIRHPARIKRLHSVPWRDLPGILATFDVQVIPLDDVPFNACKSHIRWLESAAVGCPAVLSRVGEQSLSVFDGFNGLLVDNDPESWYEALQRLVESATLREQIGRASRAQVLRHDTTVSGFMRYRLSAAVHDVIAGRLSDKISIIMILYNPPQDACTAIDAVLRQVRVPYELLLWNNSADPELRAWLEQIAAPNVKVLDIGRNVGKAPAANHLFRLAVHRFVCGLDDDYNIPGDWAERMIAAARAVPNLGWLSTNLTPDSSGLRGLGPVHRFADNIEICRADGVGGWVVFTTATARERIGDYQEHGLYGGIDGDYNRRARSLGLFTGYVRDVIGQHKINRGENLAWELHKQRIQDQMRRHGKASDQVSAKFVDFFKERADPRLGIAIKICTSTAHDENVWGDTHFGRGLARALERRGYRVEVHKHEEWDQHPVADVTLHLFGLHPHTPDPDSINLLWIISHPDLVTAEFLNAYDLIFVASERFAEHCRTLAPQRRVVYLPQATDLDTFHPLPGEPMQHSVAFVGNSRRVYRPAVRHAVANGFDLAVWGTRWEPFIDARHIRGQSLGTAQVAEVYRRARVILNDHWDDQRTWGFVNNRILDVLAAGGLVLSDANPGLPALFGDRLPTFTDERDFVARLRQLLADETARTAQAAALGDEVRRLHSFDARAEHLDRAIREVVIDYVDYKSERRPAAAP